MSGQLHTVGKPATKAWGIFWEGGWVAEPYHVIGPWRRLILHAVLAPPTCIRMDDDAGIFHDFSCPSCPKWMGFYPLGLGPAGAQRVNPVPAKAKSVARLQPTSHFSCFLFGWHWHIALFLLRLEDGGRRSLTNPEQY